MTAFDLRSLAAALGGEVTDGQVSAPGPGHSPRDRSLIVRPSLTAPGGFTCHSFAGNDWRDCRDHVAAALGISADAWRTKGGGCGTHTRQRAPMPSREPASSPDDGARIARAAELWAAASPAQGTVVERYLTGRGLELPAGADVLRFHSACPWRDDAKGAVVRVPAMLAAMRQVDGDALTAVQRTRLALDGSKLGRRMLGVAAGAAVKLDPEEAVTIGLHVAEGVETALQGRQLGFRPAWALGSAGAISAFPVLPGIEALTIHAERDATNARAVETCAARWHAAGREVRIIRPLTGSDLNDAARGLP